MTLLERLDEAARCPHYSYVVRGLAEEAAAMLRIAQEEKDREIAIRDEKIQQQEIKIEELQEVISLLRPKSITAFVLDRVAKKNL